MGFVINPYDPCVANKMVNGKQMTVCWHVDDLLVTHMEEDAITGFALALAKIYGPKTTISRGKIHEYLGQEFDFASVPGTMIVSMIKYLQQVTEEFPEDIRSVRAALAANHLFNVREDLDRTLLPK